MCHFIRASKDPPSSDYAQEGEGDNGAGEGFGQVKGKDEEGEVTWVLKRERIFYPCRDLKDLTAAHLPSLALQVMTGVLHSAAQCQRDGPVSVTSLNFEVIPACQMSFGGFAEQAIC